MSNTAQCRNVPEGASGSSTTRTRLPAPAGTSDHDNGGEIAAPSQVYCAGISPLGGIAGLASIMGMTVSALPEFHSADRDRRRAFHEERVMSETTRFRSGLLVFPNLTQLDLTGPYEVLARLPGAETLLLWKEPGSGAVRAWPYHPADGDPGVLPAPRSHPRSGWPGD